MKTYQRFHTAFHYRFHHEMASQTYRRNVSYRDKPIVHEIYLSLEELWSGCIKKMKIAAKVFNNNLIMERTEERIVRVEVPPGSKDGTKVIVPSAGNRIPGTIPGDVIFIIREREHPSFTRDDENNLIHKVKIPLRDALSGCKIDIPLICGESLTLSTSDVVCHGARKRIPGKGMPKGDGHRGDLLVEFSVVFPAELSERQKDILSSILPD